MLLNFSSGSSECEISFLRLEENLVIMTAERRVCLSSAIFVCCNDGGGGKDASQRGCRGQEMFFLFPWLLWSRESKASHVACFCFSALCAAEAPSSLLPDESRACIVPAVATGQVLGLLFRKGTTGLLP